MIFVRRLDHLPRYNGRESLALQEIPEIFLLSVLSIQPTPVQAFLDVVIEELEGLRDWTRELLVKSS